jgi:hypothetical protein
MRVDSLYDKIRSAIFAGAHPTHNMCGNVADTFESVCTKCGLTQTPSRLGNLIFPCVESQAATQEPIIFAVEQVKALCGGAFPFASGFNWDAVEHFLLEDGVLQPYEGTEILPGPAIVFFAKEESKQ